MREKENRKKGNKCESRRGGMWKGKWNNEMTNYDKFSNKCAAGRGEGRRSLAGPLETSSLAPEMGRRTCQVACQAAPPLHSPASPLFLPASPAFSAAFILSHAAAAALGARLHLASFNDAPNVSHVLIAIAFVLLPLFPSFFFFQWKMQSGQGI